MLDLVRPRPALPPEVNPVRELRLFFVAIWHDWVSLMSGIASVTLGAAGASGRGPLPDWAFWVAAAICFFVAAFRVWRTQYRQAHPFDEERERFVADQLQQLTEAERDGLAAIIVRDGMQEGDLRQLMYGEEAACSDKWGQPVHGNPAVEIPRKTQLLERDFEGKWRVKVALKTAVAQLLKRRRRTESAQ